MRQLSIRRRLGSRSPTVEADGDYVARAGCVTRRVTQNAEMSLLRPERCCGDEQREDAPIESHEGEVEEVTRTSFYPAIMRRPATARNR